jgi:hypothetical protein
MNTNKITKHKTRRQEEWLAARIEIRVGQSNLLHWMSRIAPGFIN